MKPRSSPTGRDAGRPRVLGWVAALTSRAVYAPDDRGRRVEIAPDPAWPEGASDDPEHEDDEPDDPPPIQGPPAPRTPLERFVKRPLANTAGLLMATVFFGGCIGAPVMFVWKVGQAAGKAFRVSPFVAIGIGLGSLAALVTLYLFTFGKHRRQRTVQQTLALFLPHTQCPGCGYKLDDVVPEGDGCSVCPECGAAWNLTRWKAEFPFCVSTRHFRPAPKDHRPAPDPAMLYDARGRLLSLRSATPAKELKNLIDATPTPRDAKVRINAFLVMVIGALLGLGVMVFAASAAQVRAAGAMGPKLFGTAILTGALLTFVGLIVTVGRRRARRRAVVRSLAEHEIRSGHCPVCLSGLNPTPTTIDRALVCPACSAAWKPGETIKVA